MQSTNGCTFLNGGTVDDTKAKFYLFDQVKNLTNNEGKSVGKILVRYELLYKKVRQNIYIGETKKNLVYIWEIKAAN